MKTIETVRQMEEFAWMLHEYGVKCVEMKEPQTDTLIKNMNALTSGGGVVYSTGTNDPKMKFNSIMVCGIDLLFPPKA